MLRRYNITNNESFQDRPWPFNYHLVWDVVLVITIYIYYEGLKLSPSLDQPKKESTEVEGVNLTSLHVDA